MRLPSKFGTYVRAARLGWGWSEKHEAWVRLSDHPKRPDAFVVEAHEDGLLPSDSDKGLYRVWWEGPDKGAALLDACVVLRDVRAPKGHVQWVVGMDGEVLP